MSNKYSETAGYLLKLDIEDILAVSQMGLLSYLKNFATGGSARNQGRVLLLGLDNAGKTCILKKLANEDILTVKPTAGFHIKQLTHNGLTLDMWDVGGQQSIRPYWRNYFDSVDAIIYVIDSSDRRRMEETGIELQQLLEEEKLMTIPLIILANKQDLLASLTASEIGNGLNLHAIRDRPWQIFACSAKDGSGLPAAFDFLLVEVLNKLKKK